MKAKRQEPSAWTRRDFFLRMAFRRYCPHNLLPQDLLEMMNCSLGSPERVTVKKCRLYLGCGSPTCVDCYRLAQVALPFYDPQRHAKKVPGWPVLWLLIDPAIAPPIPTEKTKKTAPPENPRLPRRADRQSRPSSVKVSDSLPTPPKIKKPDIIETAMPKIEAVPTIPDSPKSYKYLYLGTCEECGKKRQKIVAWDLCWRCHYIWKYVRPRSQKT